jgi:hypothetical protein
MGCYNYNMINLSIGRQQIKPVIIFLTGFILFTVIMVFSAINNSTTGIEASLIPPVVCSLINRQYFREKYWLSFFLAIISWIGLLLLGFLILVIQTGTLRYLF